MKRILFGICVFIIGCSIISGCALSEKKVEPTKNTNSDIIIHQQNRSNLKFKATESRPNHVYQLVIGI